MDNQQAGARATGDGLGTDRDTAAIGELDREVMAVLLNPASQTPELLEDLLNRCAAESLRLQAGRKRLRSEGRTLDGDEVRMRELAAEIRSLQDRLNLS